MEKLSADQVRSAIATMPGWNLEGAEIAKQYTFDNFMGSVGFVNRLAEVAEAANHHPDLAINWNKVRVSLSTHSANAITERDVEVAKKIDAVA